MLINYLLYKNSNIEGFVKCPLQPTELVRRIIKNFTKENDLIMDPFMGSGTTGVVCKELNRNFNGVELDKKYFEIAKERINAKQ